MPNLRKHMSETVVLKKLFPNDIPNPSQFSSNTLVDVDDSPITNFPPFFKCHMCSNYCLPPILKCCNGHLLCFDCLIRSVFCPTCNEPLRHIRNSAIDKYLSNVLFPCKYSKFGCNTSLYHTETFNHQQICEYRTCCCPCPGANCKWEGSLDQIMSHLQVTHKSVTKLHGEDIVFLATNINTPRAVGWIMIQSCFGQNFLITLEKHEKHFGYHQFFAIVQLIGSRKVAELFTYKLELNSEGRCLTWESTPRSIRESRKLAMMRADCLIFDESSVRLFEDNSNLSINVTISDIGLKNKIKTQPSY